MQGCVAGPNKTLSCQGRSAMFELSPAGHATTNAWLKLGVSKLNYEDLVFAGKLPPTYWLTIKLTDSDPLVPLSGFGVVRVIITDEPDYPTFGTPSLPCGPAPVRPTGVWKMAAAVPVGATEVAGSGGGAAGAAAGAGAGRAAGRAC